MPTLYRWDGKKVFVPEVVLKRHKEQEKAMKAARDVCQCLTDAKDWIDDSSESVDELQEALHLRKALAAAMWAMERIQERLTHLETRRKEWERHRTRQRLRPAQGVGGR